LHTDGRPHAPRWKAGFAVDQGERLPGVIARLSVAGAEIDAESLPAVGSRVEVFAELGTGDEVTVEGRVQWATATRFGVLFGPLGERETGAILRALRRSERPRGP
jgi:hypothetical protein